MILFFGDMVAIGGIGCSTEAEVRFTSIRNGELDVTLLPFRLLQARERTRPDKVERFGWTEEGESWRNRAIDATYDDDDGGGGSVEAPALLFALGKQN